MTYNTVFPKVSVGSIEQHGMLGEGGLPRSNSGCILNTPFLLAAAHTDQPFEKSSCGPQDQRPVSTPHLHPSLALRIFFCFFPSHVLPLNFLTKVESILKSTSQKTPPPPPSPHTHPNPLCCLPWFFITFLGGAHVINRPLRRTNLLLDLSRKEKRREKHAAGFPPPIKKS